MRTETQFMATQIIDLWDTRTNQGHMFLAHTQDVEPMRQILEGQRGTNDLWAQLDKLHEDIESGALTTVKAIRKRIEELL